MFVNRMIQHIVVTLMKGNAWIYTKGIRDGKLLCFPADIAEVEEHVNRNISNLASNKRNEKLCSLKHESFGVYYLIITALFVLFIIL